MALTIIESPTAMGLSFWNPAVTTLANGDYVVVSEPFDATNSSEVIVAQIFDPSGNLVGTATFSGAPFADRIIQGTGIIAAGALSGGGFVVAWDGDQFPNQNIGTIGFSADGQLASPWRAL